VQFIAPSSIKEQIDKTKYSQLVGAGQAHGVYRFLIDLPKIFLQFCRKILDRLLWLIYRVERR